MPRQESSRDAADFTLASDGLGGTMLTFQPSDNTHAVSIVSHA